MKRNIYTSIMLLVLMLLVTKCSNAQLSVEKITGLYTPEQLESMMTKPLSLEGYRTHQSGPLSRIEPDGSMRLDTTFAVEKITIPVEGIVITGWLYLPEREGPFPLVVLTNGGGDGSRSIKSLSDFIAPIMAHCGIAAFVHDKRGTGESGGEFASTTYEDYISDAGKCAVYLSKDKRINPEMVGVMGGSEGGRIAVIASCRFPEIKFVISQAGTVVSSVDDRLYAQINGMKDAGIVNDSTAEIVRPLWERSFRAWESGLISEHEKVNREITEWRKRYDRRMLPYTNLEMETIPAFESILPTWNSLKYDYLSELATFRKKWLAIFGEVDRVVPTEASVSNIIHYMSISGNRDYNIAVIPDCGHGPVNVKTGELIRIDYLVINWIYENVVYPGEGKLTHKPGMAGSY